MPSTGLTGMTGLLLTVGTLLPLLSSQLNLGDHLARTKNILTCHRLEYELPQVISLGAVNNCWEQPESAGMTQPAEPSPSPASDLLAFAFLRSQLQRILRASSASRPQSTQ